MDQQTTHITDYIPAAVLEREGFVHRSDSAKMLEAIDKGYLASQGWANLSQCRSVMLSANKAAEVIGIAPATVRAYIKSGHLPSVAGYVSLLDALTFDYPAAKEDYLNSKYR